MKVLLLRRNFSIWLFGSAAAIVGVVSAYAHVLHNHTIQSDDLSRSIGILIIVAIGAAAILLVGYPRKLKGRIFYDATDGIKKSFPIQSENFKLALRNLVMIDNRVMTLTMNWDFEDKRTGVNLIGFSSLKNEKIHCFIDVLRHSEVVKTFEVDVTNTRTFASWSQDQDYEDALKNIIEIDAKEIEGEIDVVFRDFSYCTGKYELTGIIFKVEVKVGVAASRQSVAEKSVGERTAFEIMKS